MPDSPLTALQGVQPGLNGKWRGVRFVLWTAVASALLVGALLAAVIIRDAQRLYVAEVSIDGPFRLTTHDGRTVTQAHFRGKVTAWFFGFTHCPDVCPTTLTEFTNLLRALGPRADEFTPIMVTVDPSRDKPDVLAEYMKAFDPRIVALTGERGQIDVVVGDLGAYYRAQPPEAGFYSVDHTATIFLMDEDARLAGTLDLHEDADMWLAKVERLLESGG